MEAIYLAAKERSPPQSVSNFHDDSTPEHLMKQFSFQNIGTKPYYREFITPLTFRNDKPLLNFAKFGSITSPLHKYAELPNGALEGEMVTGAEFVLNYNFVAERSSDTYARIDIKKHFMKHYTNSIGLLLAGPPNANDHGINPEKAAAWVAAQITEERRRLAQLVVNVLRYISHADLITGINDCISQLEAQYDRDLPVIFIVGSPKKSNYYVSLLFAHFWLERGNRLDYVIRGIHDVEGFQVTGNIIDIDDMGYSGSQTTGVMNAFFNGFSKLLVKNMIGKISDIPFKDDMIPHPLLSFFPHFLVEYAMGQVGLQYYLVRIFSSSKSMNMWRTQVHMPHRFITHEIIPTLQEQVGEQDARRISAVFNIEDSAMAVYFDHKVADGVSTLLVPISYGIIPGKSAMVNLFPFINMTLTAENKEKIGAAEGPNAPSFLPFINKCDRVLTTDIIEDNYENDDLRCPFAWYKIIDYNKGTYAGHGGGGRGRRTTNRRRGGKKRLTTHRRRSS